MKETLNIQPIQINKLFINTIYKSVEISLNIILSKSGKRTIRRDINHYLLIYENDLNKVLDYFNSYKENIKKLYLNYSDDSLDNIIKYLVK